MALGRSTWLAIVAILHVTLAKNIVYNINFPCPVDCHCTKDTSNGFTIQCTSLNFLSKLSTKDVEHIKALDLSHSKLTTVDQKLKKIINLEILNLSNNKIKDLKHFPHLSKLTHLNLRGNLIEKFSAKQLPTTLTNLDISHNQIIDVPYDITHLTSLRHLHINGNPLSCNSESLNIRDLLVEHKVHITGKVLCHDPPKYKGELWLHVVDLEENFRLHPEEQMMGDQPEGSGELDALISSGDGGIITDDDDEKEETVVSTESTTTTTTEKEISTKLSVDPDFDFDDDGSGVHEIVNVKKVGNLQTEQSTVTPLLIPATEEQDKHANMGTNIFLGVFLFCLLCLLVYAIKKNKEKKKEQRRKRRIERINKKSFDYMSTNPDQKKQSEIQNGNTDAVPLMNRQNGNSKVPEDDSSVKKAEEEFTAPLTSEPVNGDTSPIYPDVKSVKVKASEIPGSVPQTPILVTRNRTSDGKDIIITPNLNQRNNS